MADGERLGASFSIDVTNLKAGLTQANRLIRESESEFKACASGLDDWSKSEEGLNAKIKSLNSITEIQKKKVNALKTEYKNLIDNGLDPTSKEAVELRTKINNEESALASNEKELRKQKDALKNLGKESEDTGGKFEKLGNIAKTMGKVVATAFATASAGIIAIGKSAVESYASYEQLVGGVDTLFKDSSKKVQEYASNAYKTAGMSANEYMETVTGFSASLLQSLGGDTEKATEVADMAIRDMSDNANKMGTDMQSIQNAYGGFAKGNFTMLDNLKIGYSGSREEMQRLLADAEKLSGIKYDISSYADITEAIHTVQTEMGITGTTAKEASTTVEGSISSMKSAYSNLLTGLADDNADMGKLIDNVVESAVTVANNLIPRVLTILEKIPEAIKKLLPKIPPIISSILPSLIDAAGKVVEGVAEVLPQIIDCVLEIIPQLISTIIGMIPTILDSVVQIIVSVIDSITEMLPQIIDAVIEVIPQLIDSLLAAIPQLLEAAIKLLMAIVQAIPTIVQRLVAMLPTIISAICNTLIVNIPVLLNGAIQLFNAILQAIPIIIQSLLGMLPEIINTIVNTVVEALPMLLEGAITLFNALIEAIPIIIQALVENLPSIIQTIIDALINALPLILESAITLLMAIIDAIPTIIQLLVRDLPNIISTITSTLIKNLPTLIKASFQLFMGIIKAIPQIIIELVKQVPQIGKSIIEGLKNSLKNIGDIGKNIVSGLWQGITNAKDWLLDKIKGFAKTITKGIKDFFGIKSPSKVMADQVGKNLALGIGVGFDKNIGKVNDQITSAMNFGEPNFNINGVRRGNGIVINQTNNYSQAHSRLELYKSKQQTANAVRLAMGGV